MNRRKLERRWRWLQVGPPPAPVRLRVRHRGHLVTLTFQVGPVVGLAGRKQHLVTELGDKDRAMTVPARFYTMLKHPHNYSFSKHDVPKELKPFWEWARRRDQCKRVRRAAPWEWPTRTIVARAEIAIERHLKSKLPPEVKKVDVMDQGIGWPRVHWASWAGNLDIYMPVLRWISQVWKRGRVMLDPRTLIVDRIHDVVAVQGPIGERKDPVGKWIELEQEETPHG